MPRGKRKCVHPPLTFLHPPFSKQLGELAYVAPTEMHPEVKTTNADEKCSWISPTFKLDLLHSATNRGKHADRTKPTPNSTPVPRKTLEFVNSSDVRHFEPMCPLFPLKSPETFMTRSEILVPETPDTEK